MMEGHFHGQVEIDKTQLQQVQLQNLDAAPEPEGGDVSLAMTGKPTTTVTAEKFKDAVEAPPEAIDDTKEMQEQRELGINKPITYQ